MHPNETNATTFVIKFCYKLISAIEVQIQDQND